MAIPVLVTISCMALPAGARPAACPDGSACVWDEHNFEGDRAQVPSGGCIDSNIRSAINRTDRVLHFYLSGGCVGAEGATLQPGEEDPRMSFASASGGPPDRVIAEPPGAP
jgi:hypothetical protein